MSRRPTPAKIEKPKERQIRRNSPALTAHTNAQHAASDTIVLIILNRGFLTFFCLDMLHLIQSHKKSSKIKEETHNLRPQNGFNIAVTIITRVGYPAIVHV